MGQLKTTFSLPLGLDFAALVLLDLSAADILLQRLRTNFGIGGVAFEWFQSYLTGRTQYVRRGTARSTTIHLTCSAPQGSGCALCYTVDLIAVVERYGLHTDDTQKYSSLSAVSHKRSTTYSRLIMSCL